MKKGKDKEKASIVPSWGTSQSDSNGPVEKRLKIPPVIVQCGRVWGSQRKMTAYYGKRIKNSIILV